VRATHCKAASVGKDGLAGFVDVTVVVEEHGGSNGDRRVVQRLDQWIKPPFGEFKIGVKNSNELRGRFFDRKIVGCGKAEVFVDLDLAD
jgi:hypothetical protein